MLDWRKLGADTVLRPLRGALDVLEGTLGKTASDHAMATEHGADGIRDFLRRRIFGKEADRPRSQRSQQDVCILDVREEHDPSQALEAGSLACQVGTGDGGGENLAKRQVELGRRGALDGFVAAFDSLDEGCKGWLGQQFSERREKEAQVINHKDAGRADRDCPLPHTRNDDHRSTVA